VQDIESHAARSEGSVISGVGSIAHLKTTDEFETSSGKTRNNANELKTNFDKIVETPTSYEGIDVSLYKSRETGLKILIANVEVPVVMFQAFNVLILRYLDISP
jgi:hypothetical protein